MRKFCLQCVYKHIASAAVADIEVSAGYPGLLMYVIGNLDHAAQECAERHPELAVVLRAHRIALWDDAAHKVPYESLCEYVLVCVALDGDTTVARNWPQIPAECLKGLELNADGKALEPGDQRP